MSLGMPELLQWAKSIETNKIDEQKRNKVVCYRDMVVDRVKTIGELTSKMQRYMKDIEEYVGWLKKLGVPMFEEPKKEPEEKEPEVIIPGGELAEEPVMTKKSSLLP